MRSTTRGMGVKMASLKGSFGENGKIQLSFLHKCYCNIVKSKFINKVTIIVKSYDDSMACTMIYQKRLGLTLQMVSFSCNSFLP